MNRKKSSQKPSVLIVVDVQHDFVSGALPAACNPHDVIKNINERIRRYDLAQLPVLFTLDTHHETTYPYTQEGKLLPVLHCLEGSEGHALACGLQFDPARHLTLRKFAFASFALIEEIRRLDPSTVELAGICTDICVLANAILLKTAFPEIPVHVLPDCCAGSSPEKHLAAIHIFESCHILPADPIPE